MAYEVGPPPGTDNITEALEYVYEEFQKIRDALEDSQELVYLVERHTEPDKIKVGMVALADGSDWDPGSGRGIYVAAENPISGDVEWFPAASY